MILMATKLLEHFTKKYCKKKKKKNKEEFRIENAIERKDDKLYPKWKSYENLFNSWIDKKKTYHE